MKAVAGKVQTQFDLMLKLSMSKKPKIPMDMRESGESSQRMNPIYDDEIAS